MSSDSESSLIVPGAIRSDRPLRPAWSAGRPHSGAASRGKSTNSTAASGNPCSSSLAVRASGAVHDCPAAVGGRARTSRTAPMSRTTGTAAIAASTDWL